MSTYATAQDLWNYLKSEYDTQGQDLVGAILVGNLPLAYSGAEITDGVYWNMQTFGSVSYKHIWVSRIAGRYTARQVEQMVRALDANHNYRTGQARLPHSAWYIAGSDFFNEYGQQSLLKVWPELKTEVASGAVGNIARAVAFAAVGVLFGVAALQRDPSRVGGLDAALRDLVSRWQGVTPLVVLSVGLGAFGLYCLLDARYRRAY